MALAVKKRLSVPRPRAESAETADAWATMDAAARSARRGFRRAARDLAAITWRHRRRLARIPGAFRRLPSLVLALSEGPAGVEIARALTTNRWGISGTRAVAVLVVPADPDAYTRGHARQALRTNANRALRSGIAVMEVDSVSERHALLNQFARNLNGSSPIHHLAGFASQERARLWFAVDRDHNVIALAIVVQDVTVARLVWMLSADLPHRSDTRYLISASVFSDLARAGVRYVVTDTILWLTPGLYYFQKLLGFRPHNVTISLPPGGTTAHRAPRETVA